jgi:hypothetical protein
VHHYVAELIQVTDMDNKVVVRYLKRFIVNDEFIRNSEVYTITKEDTISKLPPPEVG